MFSRSQKILAVALVVLPLMSTVTRADTQVNIATDYYDISGDSAEDLRREMDENSGIHWLWNRYDAHTQWDVQWQYDWRAVSGNCVVTAYTTGVDIRFRYPNWLERDTSAEPLRQQWDAFYTALVAHENGHKDFALGAAKDIDDYFASLVGAPPQPCKSLEKTVALRVKAIRKHYRRMEKRYDRDTQHGRKDGALFP
jgi:predicted secreted Zn-dependent protease